MAINEKRLIRLMRIAEDSVNTLQRELDASRLIVCRDICESITDLIGAIACIVDDAADGVTADGVTADGKEKAT
ncbi:MAG: hypothetical protein IMZ50_10425 [Candidatus Atribacteria bacterium]|nr:hypothetical protein [Spirochaetota bacterium]MBE3119154.1 hypothetical protein [Candidatus Atribacteria bacterium]